MHYKSPRYLLAGLFALLFVLTNSVFGQSATTGSIAGFVTDKGGHPVPGATVVATNTSTNSHSTSVTQGNGEYNFSGLRLGGPYSITVSAPGMTPATQSGTYIELGSTPDVNFTVSSEVVTLEAMSVEEERGDTFGVNKTGTVNTLDAYAVTQTPSIRQDLQDLAQNDSRFTLVENTSTGEYQLSAAGQNYRYNSYLIDGVQVNDTFGLNGNGTSSWFSPIPYDALQSVSIQLDPYDVQYTGFTGALIDAVIKSGSNDFHGSFRYSYSDQSLRGKNPVTGAQDIYRNYRDTATFSGPLIKNHLFFFFAYDYIHNVAAPPSASFVPDAATLASVIATAQTTYNYAAGNLNANALSTGKTYVGKIDWIITDQQRLSVTYRRNDTSVPQFASFNAATATSLSNYWYQQPRLTNAWEAQIDSNWTPDFHTELTAEYTKYAASPINNGTPFPEVFIANFPGTLVQTGASTTSGTLHLGTEFSRQLNLTFTSDTVGKFYGDYTIGNHKITAGVDSDRSWALDDFVQAAYGSYTFNNAAAFAAGNGITSYSLATGLNGNPISAAFANFAYTIFGAGIQDQWRPSDKLTVTYGLRVDDPYVSNKPLYNAAFANAFGQTNTNTDNGNYTLEPRLSFNYDLPKIDGGKTQLRGGAGLFQGTNPAVWLADSYDMNGTLGRVTPTAAIDSTLTFNPNPFTQQVPPGSPPVPIINFVQKGFKPPASWKFNIAVDHELPWWNLVFTAEQDYLRVEKAVSWAVLNQLRATTGPQFMPDGRQRFNGNIYPGYNTGVAGVPTSSTSAGSATLVQNTGFNNAYELVNTDQGMSADTTLAIARPMIHDWSFSFYWTHEHATDVNANRSSVASSNFTSRAYANPNEDVAATSDYNVPQKFVAQLSRQFNFFNNARAKTVLTAVFRVQTGHPYTWTFTGDANGDGFSSNDLFYVPSGPNDPKVAWNSSTEETNFFNWLSTSSLRNEMGKIVARNSAYSPWEHTLDVHLEQRIPITGHARLTLYVDCTNFANLFNRSWGIVSGEDFPYYRRVAGASYNPAGNGGQGQYIYYFNSNTLDPVTTFTDLARYQAEIGAKLDF
jgi:hypothetical protein